MRVGDAPERIERFPRLPRESEESVTVILLAGDAAAVSLTWPLSGFRAFAARLAAYVATLPRPS